MKYVITGSTGNISKPLAQQLAAAGHEVTIISSNESRTAEITAIGATAATGSILDTEFLARTFKGADAVYLMIPPNFAVTDWPAFMKKAADSYITALKASPVQYIVQLSSIGAHLRKDCGPIDGLGYLEERLKELSGAQVKLLRPSYFYTNFFSMIPLLKQAGIMGGNFGTAEEKLVLVHPADIATVAARHLLHLDFTGYTAEYIASDERYASDVAAVLGKAIGREATPWVLFKDEETHQALLQAGLAQTFADGYTQMGKSIREGILQADYFEQDYKPAGKIKLEDFAKQFAAVYNQQ